MEKLKSCLSNKKLLLILAVILIFVFVFTWKIVIHPLGKGDIISKTKSQIIMITKAVEYYRDRYAELPKMESGIIDFGERLSNIAPGSKWSGKRPMYLNFERYNIKISNPNYADIHASQTIIFDPFGSPYYFRYDKTNGSFRISSNGADKKLDTEDDIFLDFLND